MKPIPNSEFRVPHCEDMERFDEDARRDGVQTSANLVAWIIIIITFFAGGFFGAMACRLVNHYAEGR